MRIIVIIILTFTICFAGQAQQPFTSTFTNAHSLNDSNHLQKKWSVSMYSGFVSGVGFLNTRNTAFFSPTIGVQLNRRLNNNLYAFGSISAGPSFFYPGHLFNNADYHNNYMTTPGFNGSQYQINTGIQAGLMYVNDAKTFSISGSFGVSSSNYPFYPAMQKQPALTGTKRQ